MLTELNIKNGLLSPKYDIYNDTYTVTITKEVEKLDIEYKTDNENISVVINGNANLQADKKIVSITVANGEVTKNIHLNVFVEDVETTGNLKNYFTSLEIKRKEETPSFVAPLIASSCFLLIIIIFSILFHKKRN